MGVSKESLDLVEERKSELKRSFPEVFTEGRPDFDKFKEALGDVADKDGERYSFSWAGKTQSVRTRDRRSKATLVPSRKESVDFDGTGNVFIEGENLEVLKILQKSYQGKVKMIYIDPPYNTGKDFVYPDDFKDPLANYLRLTGQVNEKGVKTTTNVETSGRYHSNWLSMMYPRLFLARNLLRDDGVIFVSIDDNEVHNLRLIMNEIFGEENFIGDIIWNSTKSVTNTALISVAHTHNLVYAKNKEYFIENRTEFRIQESGEGFSNPDNDSRGPWKADPFQVGGWRPNQQYDIVNPKTGKIYKPNSGCSWKNDYKKFQELLKDTRIIFGASGEAGPQRKRFLSEAKERGKVTTTLWDDIETTTNATTELKELFEGHSIFDNPKPVSLVKRMLELCNGEDSLILDFFAGSGTTAHTTLELNREDGGNRKFILVQLPEPTPEDSEARKAGYKTIADICKERIRRAIKKLKKEGAQTKLEGSAKTDLGFKVFKLSKSNCFVWDEDLPKEQETLVKHVEASAKGASTADKEALLFELMLREGFGLDSKIESIKQGKNTFHKVTDGGHVLWLCFDESVDAEAVKKLPLEKDDKLIVLDSSLTDTQKVNLSRKTRIETV